MEKMRISKAEALATKILRYGKIEVDPEIVKLLAQELRVRNYNLDTLLDALAKALAIQAKRAGKDKKLRETITSEANAVMHFANAVTDGEIYFCPRNPSLNPAELATVFAALRLWQSKRGRGGLPAQADAVKDFGPFFETERPLSAKEIDALCEKLNTAAVVSFCEDCGAEINGEDETSPDGTQCEPCYHKSIMKVGK